ncbi:MAG TPA: tetratricopeptide repeat protein [Terriglobia bacterium]|jgi:tetratricopeptide (TPR) repeat protein|nr:tetratricopeptide repeat protein [Terriglobia bacterium]
MAVKTRSIGKSVPEPLPKPEDIERQAALKVFENAIRHFQKKDYERAIPLFQKLTSSPIREIADRARIHLRFFESRQRQESRPKSAEAYYALGVAALNSRDFDQALQYLAKSDKLNPNQEYVHYALAAAYGLRGDVDNAFSHLKTAIELRPQNRVQARQDEDFQVLAGDPRFSQLLGADAQPSRN